MIRPPPQTNYIAKMRTRTAVTTITLLLALATGCSSEANSTSKPAATTASVEQAGDSTSPSASAVETTAAAETTAAPETTAAATTPSTESATTQETVAPTEPAPTEPAKPICAKGYHVDDATNSCVHDAPPPTVAPTTTLPNFDEGTYLVNIEIQPGIYRVGGYWARLDANMDIIDNDLVNNCPSIMVVHPEDAYIKLGGPAIALSLEVPFDPISHNCTDGSFVVGLDVQPGRYRVTSDGSSAYWARLDQNLDIIDNDLSENQSIVVVKGGDFVLKLGGTLSPLG